MSASSGGASPLFSREDAALICELLWRKRTDPDLWVRAERLAVTRLFGYRDGRNGAAESGDESAS